MSDGPVSTSMHFFCKRPRPHSQTDAAKWRSVWRAGCSWLTIASTAMNSVVSVWPWSCAALAKSGMCFAAERLCQSE